MYTVFVRYDRDSSICLSRKSQTENCHLISLHAQQKNKLQDHIQIILHI